MKIMHARRNGKRLCLVSCLIAVAGVMFAGDFRSAIITTTPLLISVANNHYLVVKNFTQEGGATRGVVSVTIDSQTSTVLSAAMIDSTTTVPETINQVLIDRKSTR